MPIISKLTLKLHSLKQFCLVTLTDNASDGICLRFVTKTVLPATQAIGRTNQIDYEGHQRNRVRVQMV